MPSILRNVVLDEVSLVDKGANPGARVALFKRAEGKMAKAADCDNDEEKDKMEQMKKAQDEAIAKAAAETDAKITKAVAEAVAKVQADAKAELERVQKASDEKVAKASEEIEKMRKSARFAELVTKAATFKSLVGKPEDFAKVYEALDGKDDVIKILDQALTAANAALAKVGGQLGSDKGADTGATAWDQIVTKAAEIRKADPKLSDAQAQKRAMEQNPDLYSAYKAEKAAGKHAVN